MADKNRLRKINDYVWEYPQEGQMNVPAWLVMSRNILERVEEGAIDQLKNVASLPGIQLHSIGLPDMHYGYGSPVGGVAALDVKEGGISPGMTGFDINCGVRLLRTGLAYRDIQKKIPHLIDELFKSVPSGVGRGGKLNIKMNDFLDVLSEGVKWAVENGYATKEDTSVIEEHGSMETSIEGISQKAIKRGIGQLGSLGAGNHFLEIQYIEEVYGKEAEVFGLAPGEVTILIHTGSRGFGHQVCSDYVRELYEAYPDIVESLPDKELVYAPAGSDEAELYLKSMKAAANFAWTNRQLITYWVRQAFKKVLDWDDVSIVYDLSHNIVKQEEYKINGKKKLLNVHRKGATRAFPAGREEVPKPYRKAGQPVFVPGSMGTASYVLVGTEKAMEWTFGSTAHGSGRQLSRHSATKKFSDAQIKNQLSKLGIYVRSASKGVLSEEAPQAYKDVNEVVESVHNAGISRKVAKLRPVGVMKG